MTSSAGRDEEQVISKTGENERRRLGTEAIEQLASGLNLAANTIEGFSQTTIDEESLKKLNDEQLMRLLEEAYNSKKKDEKITRASFNEILEDVHESLAVSDNHNEFPVLETSNKKLKSPSTYNKFDSIATLRQENMDTSSSSYVTIPATSDRSASKVDPDADTSSTKTEVEEMELDTFSDLEDNMRAHENARKLDENGNPSSSSSSSCCASSGSNVSFTTRQLKPLSIYRHNPAFHSQHVSVNQNDEIPPLSPTALQPTTPLTSQLNRCEDAKSIPATCQSAKVRRKKKAVKPDESIKAEEIDGYRGADDLESLLQFIESKPKSRDGSVPDAAAISTSLSSSSKSKPSKRSRRSDRKSKRSRTPSVTTSNKEKSPDNVQSQKTSRASSVAAPMQPRNNPRPTTPSSVATFENNHVQVVPESITTVKNSVTNLVTSNNVVVKSKVKKPKKQAGWLVDLNNEIKTKVKAKPPSGIVNNKPAVNNHVDGQKIILEENREIIHEDSSEAEPNSVQDEIIMTPEEEEEEEEEPDIQVDDIEDEDTTTTTTTTDDNIMDFQKDVCLNYSSILKFIKQEWDIVTMEISNGANDIQSKSLSVTPSDRQRLIPGSPAPQTMIEQNIPSSTHLSAFRRRDVNSPKISISPVEDEENEYEFDKVVEVRGVGVAVSHPVHELGRRSRKLTGPPMMMPQKQKSARSHTIGPPHHRSLPSSSGSISSMSSAEGSSQVVGTRGRPPTSLSVLSANSLAEVTKTIRERHSSIDGGLSPPPRVVSLEDARGFKVMTELVNHDPKDDLTPKNLSSKYTPLKPIVKSTSIQD